MSTQTTGADRHPFPIHRHASPVAAERRADLLADPGFGRVFTDHMVVINYTEGRGWHDARVEARAPIQMDPAAAVLHYAQEVFEGLKAYSTANGGASLFRPDANARRFAQSAVRLAMPPLPEELFVDSVKRLVVADRDWLPTAAGGSLYIRPFMFATEAFLGVRPSAEYTYMVIASPVGSYFKAGAATVTVWASQEYTRAASGGTGAAKCGGNYAAGLLAQAEAARHGCDQVVFLDAAERRWVEELGGMNVFFVFDDGSLSTPPLGGTILPGITRDAVITMARRDGRLVREQPYAFEQWREDAASGHLREAFACGTAAVITPIGAVKTPDGSFAIGGGTVAGEVTVGLRTALTDLQRGVSADPYGWVQHVV